MVAYLEKTDGNTEFHQIMDFLKRSLIYYALTVSPIVSILFVEQFWTTAKSRTVNNISYIDATVAGKPVTISEASIRSDLLFDDADGIDSLNNQAIFDNIRLMGNYLKDVPVPLDYFPVPTLTKKVLTFMVKQGKNFSGKVTPLFDSMLVQQTEDGGDASERPSDSTSTKSGIAIPDSNPEGSGRNHGGQSSNDISFSGNEDGLTLQSVYDLCVSLCKQVTTHAKEIKALKAQVKKLKKGVKPLITHHKSWMKSVALKTRLARKTSLNKKGVQKEYVSKQRRKSVKSFKGEPSVHNDPAFDDLDDIVDDAMDYMESEGAQDKGRTSFVVLEEKESTDKEVSTKALVSTVKPNEDQNEGKNATQTASTTTSTPTPTIFGDDETITQVFITMSQNKQKEKEKGVEIKNVEDTKRPRPTSTRSILTLRPLPKIDPKDKGKKRIEEKDKSDTESEDITEAEKKFKQLANERWLERFKRSRKLKRIRKASRGREREMYTIEQRTKFLHDTIVAQRRFLAQQRSEAIRNKPPSRNQFRNQIMTYLKHVGGKKNSDLKTKSFDEIQMKKMIKEMNEQAADASKNRVKKDDSVKGEIKEEEGTRKRKFGKRKKMKSKKRKFTSKDNEDLRLCLTIAPDEDKEVDYEILDKKYPIIEWRSAYLTTKPQYDETKEVEDVYLNVVIRSNRRRRYGDLIIMFNQSDSDEFWNAQQNWKIVSWKLHSSSGVYTIMTDEGLVIHMFVENKYPLKKEVLSQLIELKLETEEDSTMALELIRFVKKQIAELEPKDSDGDEEDP
ncbi:hypothetical protein Tco_0352090 [Tanacetum coccineum]